MPKEFCEEENSDNSSRYNRFVSKGVGRLEALLKVLLEPEDNAGRIVDVYMQMIGDRSFSNFQKILDLKVRDSDLTPP